MKTLSVEQTKEIRGGFLFLAPLVALGGVAAFNGLAAVGTYNVITKPKS